MFKGPAPGYEVRVGSTSKEEPSMCYSQRDYRMEQEARRRQEEGRKRREDQAQQKEKERAAKKDRELARA